MFWRELVHEIILIIIIVYFENTSIQFSAKDNDKATKCQKGRKMKRKLSFGGTEIPEKTQDEKDEACSAKICRKPTGERMYVHENLMKNISVNRRAFFQVLIVWKFEWI